ncbi:hypothetical protein RFI_22268 [Reticulomyxa filosa]|uniref:Uncharacterized protein n=1 Tax=Reticulomyxa filosa TaxID=46433 RepID=X6MNT4_RETFI|nr:hypothetical protein RFI_22268 [Reticulomyxa filosa]|eukprot:ETO15097.1 hypothetical protein RFI_22268 [Reticulomyxa filosa]
MQKGKGVKMKNKKNERKRKRAAQFSGGVVRTSIKTLPKDAEKKGASKQYRVGSFFKKNLSINLILLRFFTPTIIRKDGAEVLFTNFKEQEKIVVKKMTITISVVCVSTFATWIFDRKYAADKQIRQKEKKECYIVQSGGEDVETQPRHQQEDEYSEEEGGQKKISKLHRFGFVF